MKPSSRNRFGVDFFWLGLTSNHSAPLTCETNLYIWLIFPIWQDFWFQLILPEEKERKAAYSLTVERAAKEKSECGRNNQPDRWIEIGNERHSWSSDSHLTTSSDVHVVSWATWSPGCILGLPTFEANVVYLPIDVNRESAQDFALQYAYLHSLSQRVSQQKLEPGTLELNSILSVLQSGAFLPVLELYLSKPIWAIPKWPANSRQPPDLTREIPKISLRSKMIKHPPSWRELGLLRRKSEYVRSRFLNETCTSTAGPRCEAIGAFGQDTKGLSQIPGPGTSHSP